MKQMIKFKSIIAYLTITVGLISCNVERLPEDQIDLSRTFESVTDAGNWDNLFYRQLRGNVYGVYSFTTEVQADMLNATAGYGNRNGAPHRWTDFLSGDGNISTIYNNYYSAINNINVAIRGFKKISPANEAEQKSLNQYTGDAHLARAYYYLNLVLRFSKAYDPSTSKADLGVALILEPDVTLKPKRSTVGEVYTQILSDISVAKTNLQDVQGTKGASRFTIDAVWALEARVKLYMQDWEGAKAAAEELIKGGRYTLYNSAEGVLKMWSEDTKDEIIFEPAVRSPDERPNTMNIFYGYNTGGRNYRPDFLPSQWVIDKFSNTDYRKAAYFKVVPIFIQGSRYEGFRIVNKWPGNRSLMTDLNTNYNSQKVFRIAEYYLISAEASYMIKQEEDAVKRINELRKARGLTAINLTGQMLLNEIKDERFRELAFEGFRLDDLKRWREGFERKNPQSMDMIMKGVDFESKRVTAGDNKFVWGIPERDVTVNLNLTQNPGW
ncbi:RagB/SusD family nutrient uptake outer membrane protein [Sphingobacterium spiritivorum]|uniref:RagB/SusD family nutrient uptake outer membrane protein n=1 Tax=Sphingobacterium spiritivorum TaxID=258 RepID=UPI003DA6B348